MTGYSNRDSTFNTTGDGEPEVRNEDDCSSLEVESRQQLLNLLQTVEGDIIPRLVETHRQSGKSREATSKSENIPEDQIKMFALLLIGQNFEKASDYIASLRERGVSEETLYLDLFSPVAKYFGQMWEEDLCTFTEVTIGVGRLQELLREISSDVRYQEQQAEEKNRRILLTPVPGEQHTFGMSMLIEFFYRAGWEVWGWPGVTDQNLLQLVKNEWFHIVGISMYAQIHQDALLQTIQEIREASKNPAIKIMVGGHAFGSNPELIDSIGADAFAADGPQALHKADHLFELQ